MMEMLEVAKKGDGGNRNRVVRSVEEIKGLIGRCKKNVKFLGIPVYIISKRWS
jgi:hypothetical protein